MHALIIENQFLIATHVEDCLRDLGYTSFDVVETEEASIAAAEEHCPDLITADHKLASGTGVDAIHAICADRNIPFVFITCYPKEVERELPDAKILAKPISSDALSDAVREAVAAVGKTSGSQHADI
ncbi:response regulator [Sphingomonas sp. LY29]|uniref:response regulator n=1 Tax=Sphingomonas sp. LY29 TaxID=3095341 RepID=UPI002D774B70|nr:response regulator [Sphingomonas sp. LY29]WRP26634.1 response regulator [Sphingomonas sp. LY29]